MSAQPLIVAVPTHTTHSLHSPLNAHGFAQLVYFLELFGFSFGSHDKKGRGDWDYPINPSPHLSGLSEFAQPRRKLWGVPLALPYNRNHDRVRAEGALVSLDGEGTLTESVTVIHGGR